MSDYDEFLPPGAGPASSGGGYDEFLPPAGGGVKSPPALSLWDRARGVVDRVNKSIRADEPVADIKPVDETKPVATFAQAPPGVTPQQESFDAFMLDNYAKKGKAVELDNHVRQMEARGYKINRPAETPAIDNLTAWRRLFGEPRPDVKPVVKPEEKKPLVPAYVEPPLEPDAFGMVPLTVPELKAAGITAAAFPGDLLASSIAGLTGITELAIGGGLERAGKTIGKTAEALSPSAAFRPFMPPEVQAAQDRQMTAIGAMIPPGGVVAQAGEALGMDEKYTPLVEAAVNIAAIGGPTAAAIAKPAVLNSNWYRKLTIKERGLVLSTVEQMKASGMSEGEIARIRPEEWKKAFEARGGTPEGAPAPTTAKPTPPVAPGEPPTTIPPEVRPQVPAPAQAVTEAPTPSLPAVVERRAAPQIGPRERRDAALRKIIDEMSPEEMKNALRYDELTGLKSKRAFVEDAGKSPVKVALDVNGMKWVNDNIGHEVGDQVLTAVADAIHQAGGDGYRISGDEMAILSDDPAAAAEIVNGVKEALQNAEITAILPDGTKQVLKGLTVTHGTGGKLDEAFQRLNADKEAAITRGERSAERGGRPPGLLQVQAEGNKVRGKAPEKAKEGDIIGSKESGFQVVRDGKWVAFTPDKEAITQAGVLKGRKGAIAEAKFQDIPEPERYVDSILAGIEKEFGPLPEPKAGPASDEDTLRHSLTGADLSDLVKKGATDREILDVVSAEWYSQGGASGSNDKIGSYQYMRKGGTKNPEIRIGSLMDKMGKTIKGKELAALTRKTFEIPDPIQEPVQTPGEKFAKARKQKLSEQPAAKVKAADIRGPVHTHLGISNKKKNRLLVSQAEYRMLAPIKTGVAPYFTTKAPHGLHADKAAQELHALGLLQEPSLDALVEALRREQGLRRSETPQTEVGQDANFAEDFELGKEKREAEQAAAEKIAAKEKAEIQAELDEERAAIQAAEEEVVPSVEPKRPGVTHDTTHFFSGLGRKAHFEGARQAGAGVGIVVDDLTKPMIEKVRKATGENPIFVDSGAFTAFTQGKEMNWGAVLFKFRQLVEGAANPGNLYLVAPDVIGNAAETFSMQKRYEGPLKALAKSGANIIIPMQKGASLKQMADHFEDMESRLDSDNLVLGLPSNKQAWTPVEAARIIEEVKAGTIHLLGIGPGNPRYMAFMDEISKLGKKYEIFTDSVPTGIRDSSINERRKSLQEQAEEEVKAYDDTELFYDALNALSDKGIVRFAEEAGFDKFGVSPDDFLKDVKDGTVGEGDKYDWMTSRADLGFAIDKVLRKIMGEEVKGKENAGYFRSKATYEHIKKQMERYAKPAEEAPKGEPFKLDTEEAPTAEAPLIPEAAGEQPELFPGERAKYKAPEKGPPAPPPEGGLFSGKKEEGGGDEAGFSPEKDFRKKPTEPVDTDKPMSRSEIAAFLSEKFDIPLRVGRFRNALGIFKVKAEVIRTRLANDIEVISHEIGHALHKFLWPDARTTSGGLSAGPLRPFQDELLPIATQPRKGGSKTAEGFAEFIRRYVVDEADAKRVAPKFFKFFEDKLDADAPDVKAILLKARADYKRWLEQPSLARVLGSINRSPETKLDTSYTKIYSSIIDALYPFEEVVKEMTKAKSIDEVPPNLNPYKLAHLLAGWKGKPDAWLEYRPFRFRTYKFYEGVKSLREIYQPIEGNEDLWDAYRVSRRTLKIGQDKSGILESDARKVIEELEREHPEFIKALDELKKYRRALNQYMHEAGVIDTRQLLEWNKGVMEDDYSPFQRVMDYETGGGTGKAGYEVKGAPVHHLKGSWRDIISPTESDIKQTYAFIQAAEKNAVGEAFVRLANQAEGMGKYVEEIPADTQRIAVKDTELEDMLRKYGKWTETTQFTTTNQAIRETITETGEAGETVPTDERGTRIMKDRAIEALKTRGYSEAESRTIVDRISRATNTTARNRIIERVVERATVRATVREFGIEIPEGLAYIYRPSKNTPKGNVISVMRRGKVKFYEVDKRIYDAFHALDKETSNTIIRIMSIPARLLRAGATLSPEFALGKNPVRDQWTAFINSKYGYKPHFDMARGLFSAIGKDEAYWRWKIGGGEHAAMVSMDREYFDKTYKEIMRDHGLKAGALHVITKPIDALRMLSEFTESGTRIGEFKAGLRKLGTGKLAIQDAAYASREITLPFSRAGSKVKALNQIIAFWNANIQDIDKIHRQFKEYPRQTTLRLIASITIPSILLAWATHDDKDIKEVAQWQKDIFWLFPTGLKWTTGPWEGSPIIGRIPKPFIMGTLFGSFPERIVHTLMDQDPNAFDGLMESLSKSGTPGFLPTAIVPLLENWANKSTFTGRAIVPKAREGVLPEFQYQPYTTETAKKIGGLLAKLPSMRGTDLEQAVVSPAKIENLIRGYTGGLGMWALHAANKSLQVAGVVPARVEPSKALSDYPLMGAFVVRYPTADTESIKRFFDDYNKAETNIKSAKLVIKKGEFGEAREILTKEDVAKAEGIKAALTKMHRLVDLIYENPNMKPEEKRRMIDQTYLDMTAIAREGNKILDIVREQKRSRTTNP